MFSLRLTRAIHTNLRTHCPCQPTTRLRSLSSFKRPSHPNPIPATFLRSGTSKGIFLNRSSLPADQSQWDPIFLGIMGSPDPSFGRQLNGMGGGVSSLSKICVVGPPSEEQNVDVDVEYTFVQVGIRDGGIDYSGNCGNLSAMIGVFALDEGLCAVTPGRRERATVRAFNTNTRKIVDTTFPVDENGVADLEVPEVSVAGVPGKASEIMLDFIHPSGARTGKLLPSGSPVDTLEIPNSSGSHHTVSASLVDATNPTVFVDFSELSTFLPMADYIKGDPQAIEQASPLLELIRQQGAKKMGLNPSTQAQPKIALLSAPHAAEGDVDIVIHALSMGVLHKAVPLTVGLCLGVAAKTKGTIAWDIIQSKRRKGAGGRVRMRHPSGVVDVGANFGEDGGVERVGVVRTGRRLMRGLVWW